MVQKKTVRDIDVNKKKVLVRVDFNVPRNYRNGRPVGSPLACIVRRP